MGLEGPCARSPLRGSAAAHLDKRRAARSRQRRERTPNPNSAMSFARHGLRQQLRRLSPYFPRLGTMNDISSLRVDPPVTQVDRLFQGWRPEGCDRVALVLQGGGALGAYQAGVYQALHECGIEPDWVSGVSIGAINAAIIAGNVPDQRLSRLRSSFSWMTMMAGQPGRRAITITGRCVKHCSGSSISRSSTAKRSALRSAPSMCSPATSPISTTRANQSNLSTSSRAEAL